MMSNWGFRSWETAEAYKAAQARQRMQAAKARRRAVLQVKGAPMLPFMLRAGLVLLVRRAMFRSAMQAQIRPHLLANAC